MTLTPTGAFRNAEGATGAAPPRAPELTPSEEATARRADPTRHPLYRDRFTSEGGRR